MPKILASPAYKKDGLLIVTFGQVNTAAPIDPAPVPAGTDPLKVGTLLVSPFVTAGATDGVAYDPYSLLRLDRGPLRPLPAGEGRGGEGEVVRPHPARPEANGGD